MLANARVAFVALVLLVGGWLTVVSTSGARYYDESRPRFSRLSAEHGYDSGKRDTGLPWTLLFIGTLLMGGLVLIGISLATMWWSATALQLNFERASGWPNTVGNCQSSCATCRSRCSSSRLWCVTFRLYREYRLIRGYTSVGGFFYEVATRLARGESPLPPRYRAEHQARYGSEVPGVDAAMVREIAVPVGSLLYRLVSKYGGVEKVDDILHRYAPADIEHEIKRGATRV